jgi:hypothetical protein
MQFGKSAGLILSCQGFEAIRPRRLEYEAPIRRYREALRAGSVIDTSNRLFCQRLASTDHGVTGIETDAVGKLSRVIHVP